MVRPATVVTSPPSILGLIVSRPDPRLRELFRAIALVQAIETTIAEVRAEVAAIRATVVVDYLAVPETPADRKRIIKTLRAMVERGRGKRVVEHKMHGLGLLLGITEHRNGNPRFVVQFLDGERIVSGFWLSGQDKSLGKWWERKAEDFKVVTPSPVDGWQETPQIPKQSVHVPDTPHGVTPVDLDAIRTEEKKRWAKLEREGINDGLAKPKTNWCPGCKKYANQDHEHLFTLSKEVVKIVPTRRLTFRPSRSVEWRRAHSEMAKLFTLWDRVDESMNEFMRLYRPNDDILELITERNIDCLPYREAVRYLNACRRWVTEVLMVKKGKRAEARGLDDVLSDSRLFPI